MGIKQLDSGKCEFTVQGFTFQQNPKSPKLFAFVASANDLVKFCGVARKSQDLLTNYQRALDTVRVAREVTPFFRAPENCTPTAVVLSLQQTNVAEIEFKPFGTAAQSSSVGLDTLTLTFLDLEKAPTEQVVVLARDFLDSRLAQDKSEAASAADGFQGDDVEVDGTEQAAGAETGDADGDEEDEAEDDGGVEIGQSMLRQLRQKLDTPESLTPETIESLRDMLKPALVLDGQHRLFGAAGVEEDIPLLVCSLVQPSWKEQVFQFIVVNDKAAGIPKPFITSLAGMSLTGGELEELRDRLTQAGLKLWEVEVMQRLGYDPRSPFHKKIEFKVSSVAKLTTGDKTTGLGYQTMKKVGRAWYDGKSTGLQRTMDLLYCKPSEKKLSKKAARAKWQQSQDWFEFFCYFWDAFKNKFEGTKVWEIHSNLLTAVVVEMLQADFLVFLDTLSDNLYKFEEEDDEKRRTLVVKEFKSWVDSVVAKHNKSLYEKKWKSTSLNHSDGREALADLFRKVREGKSLANHPVITGNV